MPRRKTIKDKTLQKMFQELWDSGMRPDGTKPVKKKARKINRGGVEETKWLDKEEVKRLKDYLAMKSDTRKPGSIRALVNEMMVATFLTTGLRVDELCSLQFKDTPLGHRKLKIRVRVGKGRIDRSIDIPEFMLNRFEDYRDICRPGSRIGSRVFVTEIGRNQHPDNIRSKIKIIGHRAGFLNLIPHALRHTFGVHLYNTSRDIRFVQQQLGHASIITTQIYTRTDNESGREQVEGTFISSLYA